MASFRYIHVDRVGDRVTVRFNDRQLVDSDNIDGFEREVGSLLQDSGIRLLILNFQGVDFLSSAALNKLILINRQSKQANVKLRLCALRDEICEVFKLTRLDQVFDIREADENDGNAQAGPVSSPNSPDPVEGENRA